MPKGSRQRIQDAVHGLMEFTGLETSVIDVLRFPEVQRLRRIRQLGLAYQVYSAAEHSRFAHALGASHLAIRFCHQLRDATAGFVGTLLRPDAVVTRDVALAALLHDLGHGPLSHVWERFVVEDFSREAWCRELGLPYDATLDGLAWHELVGQGLIAWPDGPLHSYLEQQDENTSERIRHLLLAIYEIPYLPQLLSSDIDVDRCDFVRRDSHMSGVAHGRYDLDWLISTATVTDDAWIFGFDERKAPAVIEQFLVARRALYETVYRHKTVRVAEGMVGLFLKRLKDWLEQNPGHGPRLPFFGAYRKILGGEPLPPEKILQLDDYSLGVIIDYCQKVDDDILSDLARRIMTRDLLKMVDVDPVLLKAFHERKEGLKELEEEIALLVPEGASEYYVYVEEDRRQLTYFSGLPKPDDPGKQARECDRSQVYLIDSDGRAQRASDHPELWNLRVGDERNNPPPHRIFVPREAVERATEIVRGR